MARRFEEVRPTDEERENICLSVFGNLPPANPQDISDAIQSLVGAFPQMPMTFWGFLSKTITQNRMSKRRLDYIVKHLIETHMYPTFTIADVLKIDKEIPLISYSEFCALEYPHDPICTISLAGKKRVVWVKDAEACGYQYTRCFSPSEEQYIRYQRNKQAYENRQQQQTEAPLTPADATHFRPVEDCHHTNGE